MADTPQADPGTPEGPSLPPAHGPDVVPPPVYVLSPADAAQQQRAALVRIVRMAFVVMMMTVTILYILNIGEGQRQGGEALGLGLAVGWHIPLTAGILLSLLVLAVDMLTPRKKIATVSGVFFGLLVGLIATFAMNFVIDLLIETYEIKAPNLVSAIKVLMGISLCYLGMSIVLQTQDDFRLVIPYVEFAKQLRGPKPLILDTSALIDARVVDLGATGIFAVPLVIPRFVIEELQQLADSSEKMKRARGRRGLEVIGKLQRNPAMDLTIDETPIPGKAVDQMLVELARIMPGAIVTADAALNRVAGIQGVSVLNLNEVANALKPSLIPGTRLSIALIRRGEQPGQAIGYLEDGTMVVAEQAEHLIGSDVELEVSSALQTSAGRLIFAKTTDENRLRRSAAAGAHAAPQPPVETQVVASATHEQDPHDGTPEPEGAYSEVASEADAPPQSSLPAAPASGPITPPLTVPPPPPPQNRPGPFPPNRPQRSNAPRNPRR